MSNNSASAKSKALVKNEEAAGGDRADNGKAGGALGLDVRRDLSGMISGASTNLASPSESSESEDSPPSS